jgi:hypothetical protein
LANENDHVKARSISVMKLKLKGNGSRLLDQCKWVGFMGRLNPFVSGKLAMSGDVQ